MKRSEIVEKLINEGFSEKTLVKFSDKQLISLSERILGEQVTPMPPKQPALKIGPKGGELPPSPKGYTVSQNPNDKTIVAVAKESEIKESGLKGGQKKLDKNHNGKIDPQDFKIMKGQKKKKGNNLEMKEWVHKLAEENYHSFTSKNEIMELIQSKLNENQVEFGPKVKKGHNGIPEFMTYEQETKPSKPGTDAPVREKPTTKPGKPKRENPFEPKHTPKPKAKLPEFLKFNNIGIKLKDSE